MRAAPSFSAYDAAYPQLLQSVTYIGLHPPNNVAYGHCFATLKGFQDHCVEKSSSPCLPIKIRQSRTLQLPVNSAYCHRSSALEMGRQRARPGREIRLRM